MYLLTVVLVMLAFTNAGSATFVAVVAYETSPNGLCGEVWMFMEVLKVAR